MTSKQNTQSSEALSVSEQAADWLLLLQEGPTDPRLLQEFEAWVALSQENRDAWNRTRRTWRVLGEVPPASEHLWPGAEPQRRRSPWRWVGLGVGVAATGIAACLAIVAVPTMVIRFQADHYTTTAQSQTITLDDGSLVTLAADSALKVNFERNRREVALLKGEAFFDVRTDASRPFVVDTGEVAVTVIGTEFDVRRGDETTDITLLEGSVKATVDADHKRSERILSPGEMLTIDPDTGSMKVESIASEDIAAWREGRLYVVNASISSVVEQIQRYHPAWISVPDSALASQRVTGFYDLTDPDRALRALVEPFGGKVREIPGLARVITRL